MERSDAAPGFRETWEKIPYVTRHLGAVAIGLFVLVVVAPYTAVKFWYLPGTTYQFWRLFTSPFACQGGGLGGLLTVFFFCSNMSLLETQVFAGRRADLVAYVSFVAIPFLLLGQYLGMYAYLGGLVGAMTYTIAQEAPYEITTLIVLQIQRGWVPWVNAVIGFVVSGWSGIYEPILGIFIAHAYLFFSELLPNAGGPKVLKTPGFLIRFFVKQKQNEEANEHYGRGRRLGK